MIVSIKYNSHQIEIKRKVLDCKMFIDGVEQKQEKLFSLDNTIKGLAMNSDGSKDAVVVKLAEGIPNKVSVHYNDELICYIES